MKDITARCDKSRIHSVVICSHFGTPRSGLPTRGHRWFFDQRVPVNKLVIGVSFLWLLVSFWNRNELPRHIAYVPEITGEPAQTRTNKTPFDVVFDDVEFRIEPVFAYDITGMVVSYRHHDNNSRMHRLANDHLNMLDVCVVWGENTFGTHLYKLDFWSGIFTCNVETRDQQAWEAFNMYQLSNNHLISDDTYIRNQVKHIRIGDQIRVRGYLASYGNETGSKRGTSTTRKDTGNGACETVYVEEFDILQPATSFWRMSMYASLGILLAGLLVHFSTPYKPY